MRIVFLGASRLGHRCCDRILSRELVEVAGILTAPREFRISYSANPVTNVLHADFTDLGRRHGIPVIEMRGTMRECVESVAALRPDFLLVAGWYHLVPKAMRDLASRGCAGLHGSLLPKYRGGAPLVWAMINGERETGVTFFYFSDEVDAGDVIAQKVLSIEASDTIREVLAKAEDASVDLVTEYVPRIANGTAPRVPQDDAVATRFPQRSPEDGLIDWTWDAQRIRNFIRAQTRPYPGAFTVVGGKKLVLWDADVVEPEGGT